MFGTGVAYLHRRVKDLGLGAWDWKYGFGPEPAVESGRGCVWRWGSDRAELDQAPDRVLVQGVLASRVVQLAGVTMGHVNGAGQRAGPWRRGSLLVRADKVMVVAVCVGIPQSLHVPCATQVGDGGGQGGLSGGQGHTGPPQRALPWEWSPPAQHDWVAVEQRSGGGL